MLSNEPEIFSSSLSRPIGLLRFPSGEVYLSVGLHFQSDRFLSLRIYYLTHLWICQFYHWFSPTYSPRVLHARRVEPRYGLRIPVCPLAFLVAYLLGVRSIHTRHIVDSWVCGRYRGYRGLIHERYSCGRYRIRRNKHWCCRGGSDIRYFGRLWSDRRLGRSSLIQRIERRDDCKEECHRLHDRWVGSERIDYRHNRLLRCQNRWCVCERYCYPQRYITLVECLCRWLLCFHGRLLLDIRYIIASFW